MSDYIYGGDASDSFRRQRENGGFGSQIYENINNQSSEIEEDYSIFMKEVKLFFYHMKFQVPFSKVQTIFSSIEREHKSTINAIALVLALKYTINLNDFSELPYPKVHLTHFLKEQWKKINIDLHRLGSRLFEDKYKFSSTSEEYVRYKIYERNINNEKNIDRYILIWKKKHSLHNFNLNTNAHILDNNREIEHTSLLSVKNYSKVLISDYFKIELIKAENGKNACWINSTLFLFLSNNLIKNWLICNQYIKCDDYLFLDELINNVWNDRLYRIYYKSFRDHCTQFEPYGHGGEPFLILNFIIDEIINKKQDDIIINFENNYHLSSMKEMKNYLIDKRNENKNRKENQMYLYGIVKGLQEIPFDYNLDIVHNSSHFVSFRNVQYDDDYLETKWILFDAERGGTFNEFMTLEDVFKYGKEQDYYKTDSSSKNMACPYIFIFMKQNKQEI